MSMYIKIVIKFTIKIVHKVHNLRVLGWCWRRLQKFIPQTDFRLASRCQSDPSLKRLRWVMIKMGWREYLPTCACNGCRGSCPGGGWASACPRAPVCPSARETQGAPALPRDPLSLTARGISWCAPAMKGNIWDHVDLHKKPQQKY